MRHIPPLLSVTINRWGSSSRPGPRYASYILQYLYHSTKNGKKEFPYCYDDIYLKPLRPNESLTGLSFPRKYMPYWSKIWWTTIRIPLLIVGLIPCGVEYGIWRFSDTRSPEQKGIVVKSRIGRVLTDFFMQTKYNRLLNWTMRPWGVFGINSGASMAPYFSIHPTLMYASYAYAEGRDICRGDVVVALYLSNGSLARMGKRIAALGGEWILVTRKDRRELVQV